MIHPEDRQSATLLSAQMRGCCDALVTVLHDDRQEQLRFLVLFGSQRPERDVDLLAVYEQAPLTQRCILGRLDLSAVSAHALMERLQHHDIAATEPLLTGELVYGDQRAWQELQERYLANPPGEASLHYLVTRAVELEGGAYHFLLRWRETHEYRSLWGFWNDLSFAVSHLVFAKLYAEGRFPLTCNEARAASPLLDEVLGQRRAVAEDAVASEVAMERALLETRRTLIAGFGLPALGGA